MEGRVDFDFPAAMAASVISAGDFIVMFSIRLEFLPLGPSVIDKLSRAFTRLRCKISQIPRFIKIHAFRHSLSILKSPPNPQSPTPNPQSPTTNSQLPTPLKKQSRPPSCGSRAYVGSS